MAFSESNPLRVAVVGAGAVSDYHHVPGLNLDPRAKLVAACDTSQELLDQRRDGWGIDQLTTDYRDVCTSPDVDAVIIATPNFTHAEITRLAVENGKHVMCEKPLGLNQQEVRGMWEAAEANQVVHMTAFTYRFAPSMRYLYDLAAGGELGELRHFRSQRFLDWPETSWGWRQYKKTAGAGDLFDMTIHRIDFAIHLMGPLSRVCGAVAQFAPRDKHPDGASCEPSEVDDWSCLIGEFAGGAVGVWEGTTVAKGYGRNGFGHEWAEVNGSQASAVYRLHEPNVILLGRTGDDLKPVEVPEKYLKPEGSPRDPADGEPATVFRYDLVWEFVSAICEGRPARPSFLDGLRAQMVADSVLESYETRRWVDIPAEAG